MAINFFSKLGKYKVSDENFLTEAFVHLLEILLVKEKSQCLCLLEKVCRTGQERLFLENENLTITTQSSAAELGTPDIKIFSDNILIYIEVKDGSGMGKNQISNYKESLRRSNYPKTALVVLTRFPVDFPEFQKPDKHVRWYEIYDWLTELNIREPLALYFKEHFLEFLREKKMNIQKISSGLIEGISANMNFLDMLTCAAECAGLEIYDRSLGQNWIGVYIGNNQNFCAVWYEDLFRLRYEFYADKNSDHSSKTSHLNFAEEKFFELDKKTQLELLTGFIKRHYSPN